MWRKSIFDAATPAAQWLAGYHPIQLQTGSLQQFLIPVLWKEGWPDQSSPLRGRRFLPFIQTVRKRTSPMAADRRRSKTDF